LVTADDVNEVRDVERVLGYRLERRTVPDFDYRAPAPARDHEFARDPRPQPVARRSQNAFSPHPATMGQQGHGPRAVPAGAVNAAVRSGARTESVPTSTFRPEGTPGQTPGRATPRTSAPVRNSGNSAPVSRRSGVGGEARPSGGNPRP